jgi:hypothetical protein
VIRSFDSHDAPQSHTPNTHAPKHTRQTLAPNARRSRIVSSIMLSGSIMLVFTPFVPDPLTYLRFFIFAQTFYGFGVGGEVRGRAARMKRGPRPTGSTGGQPNPTNRPTCTPDLRHISPSPLPAPQSLTVPYGLQLGRGALPVRPQPEGQARPAGRAHLFPAGARPAGFLLADALKLQALHGHPPPKHTQHAPLIQTTSNHQGMGNFVNGCVILILMLFWNQTGLQLEATPSRNIISVQVRSQICNPI